MGKGRRDLGGIATEDRGALVVAFPGAGSGRGGDRRDEVGRRAGNRWPGPPASDADPIRALDDDQREVVCAFLEACPELRPDQVREWSARHPDLARAFGAAAETLNEELEFVGLEGRGPDEPDPELDGLVGRLLSGWAAARPTGSKS